MKSIIIFIIKLYQYAVSPFLGSNCRFMPTCSAYTIEAIQNFGIIKGIWLGMKRILRCRPGCSCGIDPLPKTKG
ncbi:membrane protein insertion efficiency factor YidD [Methylophilaceae bacterium]|nr:membrane protein insertion efficiency factor YidD [Methylophilaceae bacterium]